MIILGIETSCDETAASIIQGNEGKITVLSNIVSSQIEIHKKYGGVVPEVAAREHVLNILPVINEALKQAGIDREQAAQKIDYIAVAIGPGLLTSLIAGIETAKSLAYAWNKPVIGVNHIEGHIYANFINNIEIKFPAIILTVSGGHTMLVLMEDHGKLKTIGQTRDDAVGEAFDKAAKLMNIGYPGGPIVSKLATAASSEYKIELPRPMMYSDNFDFSFSGLKTALLYELQKDKSWKEKIPEYCREFQQAAIDVLIHKTIKAAQKLNAQTIMLSGGVSANNELRKQLEIAVKENLPDADFSIPDLKYTTDNAAMMAAAGYFKALRKDVTNWKDLCVDCNLEL